uniref:Uncharacterized protein n=1 Tax=Arundo donax TaxID=35708 RepID=A0A0A9B0H3_ARUDO
MEMPSARKGPSSCWKCSASTDSTFLRGGTEPKE